MVDGIGQLLHVFLQLSEGVSLGHPFVGHAESRTYNEKRDP